MPSIDVGEIIVPTVAGGVLGYLVGRKRGAVIGAVALGGLATVGSALKAPADESSKRAAAVAAVKQALGRVDLTRDADPVGAMGEQVASGTTIK